MFNRKKKLGRRTIKQWFIHIVRRLLRKEYCKICGQELTEIRGRYPKEPRRKVCACCATEKLEWIEEQNNVEAKCSNSVKKLEVGKDYDNDVVVFDRVSDIMNKVIERLVYKNNLSCSGTSNWREATEEEVIEAFRKHLVHRYGED